MALVSPKMSCQKSFSGFTGQIVPEILPPEEADWDCPLHKKLWTIIMAASGQKVS